MADYFNGTVTREEALENFAKLFTGGDFFKYTLNTLILWLMGFVPLRFMASVGGTTGGLPIFTGLIRR